MYAFSSLVFVVVAVYCAIPICKTQFLVVFFFCETGSFLLSAAGEQDSERRWIS